MSKVPSNVQPFSTLLLPLNRQPSMEIGGKKLVGRSAVDMGRLRAAAEEKGYKEGYARGFQEAFEDGQKQGYDDGYKSGLEAGRLEYLATKEDEIASLRSNLSALLVKIDASMVAWYEQAEPALAELSALIAMRIVAKELSLSHDAITALVREALLEVTHSQAARIRLNPAACGIAEDQKPIILAAAASLRSIDIVEDASISGGCMIETDGGVVDARIETKIAEVLEALRRAA